MKNKIEDEVYNDGYYHIGKDIEEYPDAWCYIVYSRRGPGKTYGGLRYPYNHKFPFVYMKRTKDDVNLICSGDGKNDFDPSPYAPLNRDFGLNIKPIQIGKGFGAFWNMNDAGEPEGSPVSYILALNAVKTFKGFDFSQCDWIIFDEFIPQIGERTSAGRKEGELLLDLYFTVARDRQKRGRKPLKLILFANAEDISTPVTETLEVVDDMADLNASGKSHIYLKDRKILIHHITSEEIPITEDEKQGIFEAMAHTAWGAKTFEGEFSNNDFTNVMKMNLKHFKPYIHLHHKTFDFYIYMRDDGMVYMCRSKNNCMFNYDLNKENDQKLFYIDHGLDLRERCINDEMKFQSYSMYDLIINFKNHFDI